MPRKRRQLARAGNHMQLAPAGTVHTTYSASRCCMDYTNVAKMCLPHKVPGAGGTKLGRLEQQVAALKKRTIKELLVLRECLWFAPAVFAGQPFCG